jgi:hypothetical protein
MGKGKLRTVHLNGVKWKYVVESSYNRWVQEIRIYKPETKVILKRVEIKENNEWHIERITPSFVKQYIQENLI